MRMRLDGVSFEVPPGLEDSTSYVYRSESPFEELAVELELPPGGNTPAAEVIDDIRESLAGFYQGDFVVEAEAPAMLAGQPAHSLRYRLGGGDELTHGKIIVGNPAEAGGDWVKLNWLSETDHAGVDARVDAIAASFTAVDGARAAPASSGHLRVQAGPWLLEVPASLEGPRTFIFEDPMAELRVELLVLRAGAAEPRLESAEAARAARGSVEQREAAALDAGQGERVDLRISSAADPHGESTVILAKRRVDLEGERAGEHRWITLSAAAPSAEGPRLTTLIDDLLASLQASADLEEGTP
jgi:hypothetical protein